MPINPNALGAPQPEGPAQPAEGEQGETKRKRRTKAELIADAVVPADDALIEIKDAGTGAKVQRPWVEAVALVKAEQAEFVDKGLKYALLKLEQIRSAAAFSDTGEDPAHPEPVLADDLPPAEREAAYADKGLESHSTSVPPEAALGDEVVVGVDVYRVGNGGVLTSSPVADSEGNIVKPKRRWQRELGAGHNGPWESRVLTQTSDPRPVFDGSPASAPEADQNGKGSGEVTIESERQPVEIERVGQLEWKIGTGILEKIGLPDYSSLQVGPITASRMAIDDGRRTTVMVGDREARIPTAVIEVAREACDIVEYIARAQRGELVSFLESTGALKQPVS